MFFKFSFDRIDNEISFQSRAGATEKAASPLIYAKYRVNVYKTVHFILFEVEIYCAFIFGQKTTGMFNMKKHCELRYDSCYLMPVL